MIYCSISIFWSTNRPDDQLNWSRPTRGQAIEMWCMHCWWHWKNLLGFPLFQTLAILQPCDYNLHTGEKVPKSFALRGSSMSTLFELSLLLSSLSTTMHYMTWGFQPMVYFLMPCSICHELLHFLKLMLYLILWAVYTMPETSQVFISVA